MEFKDFIEKATAQVNKMSSQEKNDNLLNLIRLTPPGKRKEVLQLLSPDTDTLHKQIAKAQAWLDSLENQEYHFLAEGYESYEQGYWDSEYEYTYEDPKNIGSQLEKTLELARNLVYQKNYQQALELYESCCMFPFIIYDENSEDQFEYELEELVAAEIVDIDLKTVASHLLFALLQCTSKEHRIKKFYDFYSWPMCRQVTLADIFSVGPVPLSDVGTFLQHLIQFLKEVDSPLSAKLFFEAVVYSSVYEDIDTLYALAQETAVRHPALYLLCMERLVSKKDYQRALTIGLDGLKRVPLEEKVRSDIAIKVTQLAEKTGHVDAAHFACQETFYSNPQQNYLLPVLELALTETEKQKLLHFVENSPHIKDRTVYLFFLKQFEDVYQIESKDKNALGWRQRTKGTIIPLFLLLLQKRDLSSASSIIMSEVFQQINWKGNFDDFQDQYNSWKDSVQLSKENEQRYLAWCIQEVTHRAESMIDTKYAKHYRRIAALLIAAGEAEEDCGKEQAREQTIHFYAKKHSRKRNFISELNSLKY